LIELLESPTQRAGLAAAGEERVAGYDWSVVGAAYRDLYSRYVS
jgi:glycosyltransferase involved in cell wall biosynthesis